MLHHRNEYINKSTHVAILGIKKHNMTIATNPANKTLYWKLLTHPKIYSMWPTQATPGYGKYLLLCKKDNAQTITQWIDENLTWLAQQIQNPVSLNLNNVRRIWSAARLIDYAESIAKQDKPSPTPQINSWTQGPSKALKVTLDEKSRIQLSNGLSMTQTIHNLQSQMSHLEKENQCLLDKVHHMKLEINSTIQKSIAEGLKQLTSVPPPPTALFQTEIQKAPANILPTSITQAVSQMQTTILNTMHQYIDQAIYMNFQSNTGPLPSPP